MRFLLPVASVLALAACQPPATQHQGGVGFDSYPEYLRRQAAAQPNPQGTYARPQQGYAQNVYGPPPGYAGSAPAPAASGAIASAPITSGPITSGPIGAAPAPVATAQAAPAPAAPAGGPARISDENDFNAVSSRESIESDKARIAQNRAQYQQVMPTALPERAGSGGPNIVEYALRSTNLPGQPVYRRSGLALSNSVRACGAFASPDLAQEEFLRRGGPERDPKNLDPDGDGFACSWDPRPFRTARSG